LRQLINQAHQLIQTECSVELAASEWSIPPTSNLGDLAFPLFKIAKLQKTAPHELAKKMALSLNSKLQENPNSSFSKFEAAGPYLNTFINWKEITPQTINSYQNEPTKIGASKLGQNKKLIVEFSSPNIAKEIALHHLRSTAIGNALSNIAELHGYNTLRMNYLGDWGTTHGKLITAHKMWGNESELKSRGLGYMLEIYIRFNKAEKEDVALADLARETFKKLEDGDSECHRIWSLFREISIEEFKKIYKRLGIHFDHFEGESFYQKQLDLRIQEIDQSIGTEISDGALVCKLAGHSIPILLKKADGASLYITRDIAAIQDRFERFAFDELWYVVAVQQKLHFKQLFDLVKAIGKPFAGKLEHISFGMLSFGSKTMKTREGNIIFLSDVLKEAKERAEHIIKEKNPNLSNIEQISEMIGVGAILFNDLSQNRTHDISFDWATALSFEGDTAPFVQYSHARCTSLEKKAAEHLKTLSTRDPNKLAELFEEASVHNITRELLLFQTYSERALNDRDPSQIAHSILAISKSLNQMYHKIRFLNETDASRLELLLGIIRATKATLKQGLKILGIQAPQEM